MITWQAMDFMMRRRHLLENGWCETNIYDTNHFNSFDHALVMAGQGADQT